MIAHTSFQDSRRQQPMYSNQGSRNFGVRQAVRIDELDTSEVSAAQALLSLSPPARRVDTTPVSVVSPTPRNDYFYPVRSPFVVPARSMALPLIPEYNRGFRSTPLMYFPRMTILPPLMPHCNSSNLACVTSSDADSVASTATTCSSTAESATAAETETDNSMRGTVPPTKPPPSLAYGNTTVTRVCDTEYQNQYFSGSVSLALESDEDFLSPLHSFMRKYCVEAFSATQEDVADPRYASQSGRMVGQCGIRCVHCKHRPVGQRQERAVCFPSSLKNIYHSIETWQRRHSHVCQDIPAWVKKTMLELIQKSKSGAGGRRHYWEESARRVGLGDTPNGIRFLQPPGIDATFLCDGHEKDHKGDETHHHVSVLDEEEPGLPVVESEDQQLVTDYLFLLLEQMETCKFTEEDRAGGRSKVKDCPVGFPGIRCRHCTGKAGFGRYFPTSTVALCSANSDRNIFNHILKCRRCPRPIQEKLTLLREEHHVCKNRRGSRKLFFARVWDRIHNTNERENQKSKRN